MEINLLFIFQIVVKINYNKHLSGILQFAKYFPVCFDPQDNPMMKVYLFSHITDEEIEG